MIEQYSIPQPDKNGTPSRYQNPVDSCEHAFEVRRMFCSNGAIQFRKQCPRCGKGLPAIARSALTPQERDQAPPYDQELQNAVRHAAWEQRKASSEYTEDDYWARWWAWYNGYLASPVWSRRRAAVLGRNGGMCESCRKSRATIAHHLTYDHVGAEPLFELVAVCSSCHDQIHPREEL